MPCPSDFSCSNGGVVDTSGFLADKTCCDCFAAGGFIGSTCTMCSAANVADAGIPECVAINDDNIFEAKDLWFFDEAAATAQYGHISIW
jgi:hypothetical protein